MILAKKIITSFGLGRRTLPEINNNLYYLFKMFN